MIDGSRKQAEMLKWLSIDDILSSGIEPKATDKVSESRNRKMDFVYGFHLPIQYVRGIKENILVKPDW